jgi:hypothetical protein
MMVPAERIELPTFALQMRCATAAPRRPKFTNAGVAAGNRKIIAARNQLDASLKRTTTGSAGRLMSLQDGHPEFNSRHAAFLCPRLPTGFDRLR